MADEEQGGAIERQAETREQAIERRKKEDAIAKIGISRMLQAWPGSVEGRDRFGAVALGLALNDPALAKCSLTSKLLALKECCVLGLVPGPHPGHCYVLPFWNGKKQVEEAKVIVDYKGHIELAYRSGKLAEVRAREVYVHDDFDLMQGSQETLVHRPWWFIGKPEPGPIRAAYCCWRLTGETATQFEVLNRGELLAAKQRSQTGRKGKGPWITDEAMMCRKTACHRAKRYWPQTPEMAHAWRLDEQAEAGEPQFKVPEIEPQDTPFSASDMGDGEAQEQPEAEE